MAIQVAPEPEYTRRRPGPLLEVRDLRVDFDYGSAGLVRAVDSISYTLDRGEVLGIVGESGSGKSVSALALLRLLPTPPARISGAAVFDGQDLLGISEPRLEGLRGNRIAMCFQDATTALNPVLTIGRQIGEVLRLHKGLSPAAARTRTIELLSMMGIPAASQRIDDYPYQFSGGMRQRAMIAMAIACEPLLLIADEATTALDVTIQAQILELLRKLQAEIQMSVIMITHDLGVVASTCDRVNVMYGGRIVETGLVREIFRDARMPYTWGLLDSLPRIDAARGRLRTIDGQPPNLSDLRERCRFAPRCAYAKQMCRESEPDLIPLHAPGHLSRCWGTQSDGWVTRP